MLLYHATSPEAATAILRHGFRDAEAGRDVDTGEQVGGVWFTSNLAGECDRLDAVVIAVDVPESIAETLLQYGLDGRPKHYGVLPAATVNGFDRWRVSDRER